MATPLVDRHAITPPAPDAPTPRGGRSSFIERALQVMDHLQATAKPATAYDIARSISAPVSTVYLVTEELVRQRMLARNDAGEIWLGPRLFHYGLAYASSIDVLTVATDQMHALSRTIGETVQLCGRDEDRMVVMALAIGPGAKRVPTRVGARVPLNWTASGRLLVGHLPMAERIAVFERSARPSPTGRERPARRWPVGWRCRWANPTSRWAASRPRSGARTAVAWRPSRSWCRIVNSISIPTASPAPSNRPPWRSSTGWRAVMGAWRGEVRKAGALPLGPTKGGALGTRDLLSNLARLGHAAMPAA
jgi:hypothetical protein